ncbi:MAG: efflux RND transporter periplasmic adaptor subunit [Chitinophagaceae bacterium]
MTIIKPLLYFNCILSAGILLTGCGNSEATKNEEKKAKVCVSDSLAKIIHIDTAGIANIDDELKLAGEISFNDNKVVKVFPFSSGQVQEVKVSIGDKVTKGQTLAVIKSADVAGNYSDLATSGNDVAITKKQLDNAESLYKNGIASEREYLEAKENYNKAVTAANKVKEMIAINGGGHTNANGVYVITAPMSGYVVEKKISQGGFIRNDNGDNLFTIGDISDVWVWANVYESDIAKVKEGYTAKVTTLAYPDSVFKGVVDKVNQILDPVTKVMKIRVRLANPGLRMKPEMFANIIIENKEGKQSVVIPSDGVLSDNGKHFVIVYHDKCNLELREIAVLKSTSGKDFISNGLKEGEKIIGDNQVLLYNALKE